MTKREELVALADWVREPDYADAFSLSDVVDWMNRRPVATAESLRAQASASPPEREANLREALIYVRSIIAEAALTGFNWKDGDWTIRLFKSQAVTSEALSSRDDGEADKRTAPASCPNCHNESDCSNVDICNAVEEVYRPSEAPSTIPADVLAMKEALEPFALIAARIPSRAGDQDRACDWCQIGTPSVGEVRRAAAAISRIDVPGNTAVKVKPLEWRDHRPDSFPEPAWSAQTPFGFYNIEEVCASDSPAYVVRLHAHHFIADKDDLADAKSAAQADYETRIKSALDIEAQGVAVSVEELAAWLNKNGGLIAQTALSPAGTIGCMSLARALLDKYSIRSAMTEGE